MGSEQVALSFWIVINWELCIYPRLLKGGIIRCYQTINQKPISVFIVDHIICAQAIRMAEKYMIPLSTSFSCG